MMDAQHREQEAKEQAQQREREMLDQIRQLERELGKAEGELAALRASKHKGF